MELVVVGFWNRTPLCANHEPEYFQIYLPRSTLKT